MAADPAGSLTPTRTPPPPSGLCTPPAPRLGFYDAWEPYPPRRPAAKSSSQRATARTPSPRALFSSSSTTTATLTTSAAAALTASTHEQVISPLKSPRRPAVAGTTTTKKPSKSSPSSSSPKKNPAISPMPLQRPRRTLTAAGTASAAILLGLEAGMSKQESKQESRSTLISQATGMLPTPSKTPQKQSKTNAPAKLDHLSRTLFPASKDSMPSPRKKRAKKYGGVTMESFTAEVVDDSIEIFTDSQDRVPQKDESADNPFFGQTAGPSSKKRSTRRRFVHVPGEGAVPVDEAFDREDGMVYVFRGKRFFRKFSENDGAQSQEGESSEADAKDAKKTPSRRQARSSVRPRLLFPPQESKSTAEDDEAVTDVEDASAAAAVAAAAAAAEDAPKTPEKASLPAAKTPEAPKFAPVSPPYTRPTTRSANKLAKEAASQKNSGRRSPFDHWPRTKEHKASPMAKRRGDNLSSASTKKSRA